MLINLLNSMLGKFGLLSMFLMSVVVTFSQNTTTAANESPLDGVYEKKHSPEKRVVPYPPVREADIMWEKRVWRMIDLREKMNIPFGFPIVPNNNRKSLFQIFYDAITVENSLAAYDPAMGDDFKKRLTPTEVKNIGNKTKTVTLTRSEPPYDQYDTTIIEKFEPSNVKKFKIKEVWFFDRHRSVMDVRILGICPTIEIFDENTGESKGFKDLFWVYFPEARPLLTKYEVFVRHNDGPRPTYDDIFHKRLFSSYIYKVTNSYDRRIEEYLTGIDALLEGEELKEEIRNFEHDLWEY